VGQDGILRRVGNPPAATTRNLPLPRAPVCGLPLCKAGCHQLSASAFRPATPQPMRAHQDVFFPVHLVVELIETEFRLVLRLSIQTGSEVPELYPALPDLRQSPPFPPSQGHQKQGPSLHRSYPASWAPLPPFRGQMVRRAFWRTGRDSRDNPGPPPLRLDYLSGIQCSLPSWTVSVLSGYELDALQRRAIPHPRCLPRSCAGSASTLPLSRPAQALLALRPARLLAHRAWTLSPGSDQQGYPHSPLAS
jgi:hypothetical protein